VYVATSPAMKRLMADGAEAMGVRLAKEALQGVPDVQELLNSKAVGQVCKENYGSTMALPRFGEFGSCRSSADSSSRDLAHYPRPLGSGGSGMESTSPRSKANRQDIRCYFCHGQHYMTRCRAIREAQIEYNIQPL
jgi:hypothetical protein